MQFISDRESLAEEFVFQTEKQSSYLLSSRASRRRILCEQSIDPVEQQIEDFKQEIEQKYIQSVSNKIYTFPLTYSNLDIFDDSQYKQLEGDVEISLYNEQSSDFRKNKFKILNKKIKNEKVNDILSHIKNLKQNIITLTLYKDDSLGESSETKPTNKISLKKSKQKSYDKSGRLKPHYQTLKDKQQNFDIKKILHTEPYEKPLGYIVKKR